MSSSDLWSGGGGALWRIFAGVLCLFSVAIPAGAADQATLWAALRERQAIALIRHALAPGFGDPRRFKLDDCSTQRNLSAEGRQQARRIGDLFRRNGISGADVYTSQWCRCRETAALLDLGGAEDLPSLNSFFQNRSRRRPQTAALKHWLDSRIGRRPLVLVTHQVNISALTGRTTRSGEIVVVKLESGAAPKVLGTIETSDNPRSWRR